VRRFGNLGPIREPLLSLCPKTSPRGKWALRSLTVGVSGDARQRPVVTNGSPSPDGDQAERVVLFEVLRGASRMVVRHILAQCLAQMTLIEDDLPVQASTPRVQARQTRTCAKLEGFFQ
jgi:hypothetical protein